MEKKLLAVPVMLGTLVNGKHEELFAPPMGARLKFSGTA
jgi:hypothetical protein